jgi:integrating conjugative element protein (TIGR03761 family)
MATKKSTPTAAPDPAPAPIPAPGNTETEAAPAASTSAAPEDWLVTPVSFEVEPNSPFTDGYSIAKEEATLASYVKAGADETDPLYDRFVELTDRKERLVKMQAEFTTRKGADAVVSHDEASGIDDLGALVDEEVDQMELHTKEAYRMFMGRGRDPVNDLAPITGGKRIAAALRALWLLTANDNPFADWGLLRHEHAMSEVHKRLKQETVVAANLLADQKRRGLTYSVLRSSQTKTLNLGYRSPYGYAISNLIVDFDYFVRLQLTLARKNLRADDKVRRTIHQLTRFVRRCWIETARFERWLKPDEVRALSRADFMPGAAPEGAKRVEFVTSVFGAIPSEVYNCVRQPSHSRRRVRITPNERKLLQAVAAELAQNEQMLEQDAVLERNQPAESDAGLL